jgi:hypothetical protein
MAKALRGEGRKENISRPTETPVRQALPGQNSWFPQPLTPHPYFHKIARNVRQ